MGNMLVNFALAHQQMVEGLILGAVLTHPTTLALALFNVVVKIPGVGPWIAKNPTEAKSFADGFDKAIDEAIDKYSTPAEPAPK